MLSLTHTLSDVRQFSHIFLLRAFSLWNWIFGMGTSRTSTLTTTATATVTSNFSTLLYFITLYALVYVRVSELLREKER